MNVLVDGVDCEVKEALSGSIRCVTGKKDSASLVGYQPGQPGLKRVKNNADSSKSFVDLVTAVEIFETGSDTYKEEITGWFTAPASGKYRFLLSCDDGCNLYFNNDTAYAGTPLEKRPDLKLIAKRGWSIGWRQYFYNKDEGQRSEWITLEKGKQYFMMAESTRFSNMDHLTVSLEIEPTDKVDKHPKSSRSMQQLSLDQVNTFEQWRITVSSPDGGKYIINFLNPTTTPASLWKSDELSNTADAQTFKNRILPYYNKFWRIWDLDVKRTMFTSNGDITEDATTMVTITYTVTLKKLVTGFSVNAISVKKVSTASTFTIASPNNGGVQSSAPMSGFYQITCTGPSGAPVISSDIKYDSNPVWIANALHKSIPFLTDKVEVLYDYKYAHWENGVSFILHFIGLDYAPPLCQIHPSYSNVEPLTGNEPVIATTKVVQEFGQTILFEPITLDFLTSDA